VHRFNSLRSSFPGIAQGYVVRFAGDSPIELQLFRFSQA